MIALVLYEYLLTMEDEWTVLFQRKWTGSTVLFIVNRHLTVLTVVVYVIPFTAQVSSVVTIGCIYPHTYSDVSHLLLAGLQSDEHVLQLP